MACHKINNKVKVTIIIKAVVKIYFFIVADEHVSLFNSIGRPLLDQLSTASMKKHIITYSQMHCYKIINNFFIPGMIIFQNA